MMLGIVWTHSRLPNWEMVPDYFHQLAIFNEIGEDAVGPFFLITGFLFFRTFHIKGYFDKIRTRWHTLILPYLIWNIIGALTWYVAIHISGNRFICDGFSFDTLGEVIGNILACKYTVLWYVGVIIVYAFASPVFYYLVRNKRRAIFSIVLFFIIGISFHHPFCSPLAWMSIYMLGAFLGVYYKDFLFKPQPSWLTWLGIISFPFSVWFDHEYDNMLTVILRQWLSVFFYIGLYDLINHFIHFAPHRVYKYSFFLYATHYFFLHICQRYVLISMDDLYACWIAYLFVPPLVVVVCVSIGYILDKKSHQLYCILSGNR